MPWRANGKDIWNNPKGNPVVRARWQAYSNYRHLKRMQTPAVSCIDNHLKPQPSHTPRPFMSKDYRASMERQNIFLIEYMRRLMMRKPLYFTHALRRLSAAAHCTPKARKRTPAAPAPTEGNTATDPISASRHAIIPDPAHSRSPSAPLTHSRPSFPASTLARPGSARSVRPSTAQGMRAGSRLLSAEERRVLWQNAVLGQRIARAKSTYAYGRDEQGRRAGAKTAQRESQRAVSVYPHSRTYTTNHTYGARRRSRPPHMRQYREVPPQYAYVRARVDSNVLGGAVNGRRQQAVRAATGHALTLASTQAHTLTPQHTHTAAAYPSDNADVRTLGTAPHVEHAPDVHDSGASPITATVPASARDLLAAAIASEAPNADSAAQSAGDCDESVEPVERERRRAARKLAHLAELTRVHRKTTDDFRVRQRAQEGFIAGEPPAEADMRAFEYRAHRDRRAWRRNLLDGGVRGVDAVEDLRQVRRAVEVSQQISEEMLATNAVFGGKGSQWLPATPPPQPRAAGGRVLLRRRTARPPPAQEHEKPAEDHMCACCGGVQLQRHYGALAHKLDHGLPVAGATTARTHGTVDASPPQQCPGMCETTADAPFTHGQGSGLDASRIRPTTNTSSTTGGSPVSNSSAVESRAELSGVHAARMRGQQRALEWAAQHGTGALVPAPDTARQTAPRTSSRAPAAPRQSSSVYAVSSQAFYFHQARFLRTYAAHSPTHLSASLVAAVPTRTRTHTRAGNAATVTARTRTNVPPEPQPRAPVAAAPSSLAMGGQELMQLLLQSRQEIAEDWQRHLGSGATAGLGRGVRNMGVKVRQVARSRALEAQARAHCTQRFSEHGAAGGGVGTLAESDGAAVKTVGAEGEDEEEDGDALFMVLDGQMVQISGQQPTATHAPASEGPLASTVLAVDPAASLVASPSLSVATLPLLSSPTSSYGPRDFSPVHVSPAAPREDPPVRTHVLAALAQTCISPRRGPLSPRATRYMPHLAEAEPETGVISRSDGSGDGGKQEATGSRGAAGSLARLSVAEWPPASPLPSPRPASIADAACSPSASLALSSPRRATHLTLSLCSPCTASHPVPAPASQSLMRTPRTPHGWTGQPPASSPRVASPVPFPPKGGTPPAAEVAVATDARASSPVFFAPHIDTHINEIHADPATLPTATVSHTDAGTSPPEASLPTPPSKSTATRIPARPPSRPRARASAGNDAARVYRPYEAQYRSLLDGMRKQVLREHRRGTAEQTHVVSKPGKHDLAIGPHLSMRTPTRQGPPTTPTATPQPGWSGKQNVSSVQSLSLGAPSAGAHPAGQTTHHHNTISPGSDWRSDRDKATAEHARWTPSLREDWEEYDLPDL